MQGNGGLVGGSAIQEMGKVTRMMEGSLVAGGSLPYAAKE